MHCFHDQLSSEKVEKKPIKREFYYWGADQPEKGGYLCDANGIPKMVVRIVDYLLTKVSTRWKFEGDASVDDLNQVLPILKHDPDYDFEALSERFFNLNNILVIILCEGLSHP